MDKPTPFLTTPVAVLIGAVMISISILIHGGIIKIGSRSTATVTTGPAPSGLPQAPTPPSASLDQVKAAFTKSLIKFGDTNKKLTILEIADPSCPYCHAAAGKNSDLNKQMGAQFTLVADGGSYVAPVPELKKLADNGQAGFSYIYFPGHGNGEMGARALYCAFEKGRFWEVHDLLMSSKGYDLLNNTVKNDKSKSGDLANFLQPVFDPTSMKQCLDSGKYDNQLKDDQALAQSLGVSGTPGFYLNDKLYGGAYNYKDMESTVKTALGQ